MPTPAPSSSSVPFSRPRHVIDPTLRDITGGCPNGGNGMDSQRTAPRAATSWHGTLSPTHRSQTPDNLLPPVDWFGPQWGPRPSSALPSTVKAQSRLHAHVASIGQVPLYPDPMMIQVHTDDRSGSQAAQKKRKRDAQASQRFRDKRKRAEEQTSARISGLQERNASLEEQVRVKTGLIQQQEGEIARLKKQLRTTAEERDWWQDFRNHGSRETLYHFGSSSRNTETTARFQTGSLANSQMHMYNKGNFRMQLPPTFLEPRV